MEEAIIQLDHIRYSYGQEVAISDISLTVNRGDFLGIIGPNGSGKTTLLKVILGLLKPTEGTVSLFGKSLALFKEWGKVGYVPQKAAFSAIATKFPITVEEVVSMGLLDNMISAFALHEHPSVTHALKAVEMEDFRKRLLTDLSGGQQQRVFIARALVSRPQLLILDEPTVGIDLDIQTQFYELLKRLNTEHNLTLILVSHDIDVMANEVKTVAFINRKLIFCGSPKEVITGDNMENLYGKKVRFLVHTH